MLGLLSGKEENTDVDDTVQPAVFMEGVNEDYQLMAGRPEEIRVKKQALVTFPSIGNTCKQI